jgi:hypothetical protein
VSLDRARHIKVAAQAVRAVPELIKQNSELTTEIAKYRRRDRVTKVAQTLASKGYIGEHEVGLKVAELSGKDDEYLSRLEIALEHVGPQNLKLGQVEAEGSDEDGDAPDGLTRLLLSGDPEEY